MKNSRCFIITGCHRGGTSLTSHLCYKMGMFFGEKEYLIEPDFSNTDGYYENREFTTLNDNILQAAGGAWYNPPGRDAIDNVIPQYIDRVKKLIEKHKSNFWGIKDPRLSYAFPIYKPYLEDINIILIKRDRSEVINSIYRTHIGSIPTEYRTKERIGWLYDEYMSRGQELADNYPSIELFFEKYFSSPDNEIKKLANFLRYDGDMASIKPIIKPELRHFEAGAKKKSRRFKIYCEIEEIL